MKGQILLSVRVIGLKKNKVIILCLIIMIMISACSKKTTKEEHSIENARSNYASDQEEVKTLSDRLDFSECSYDMFPDFNSFTSIKYNSLDPMPAKDSLDYMMKRFKELGLDYIKEEDILDCKYTNNNKTGFLRAVDTISKINEFGEDSEYNNGGGFSYKDENVCLLMSYSQVYRFDDGRTSRYMNNELKPNFTADGPDQDRCIAFVYKTAISDELVYDLADCQMSVAKASKIAEDYFMNIKDPYPIDPQIGFKTGEVWVYNCGEHKAYYLYLSRIYNNIPFLCSIPESGGIRDEYNIFEDLLGVNITDSSGVCSYYGPMERGRKITASGDVNYEMLSLKDSVEILSKQLAPNLRLKIKDAGLYYAKILEAGIEWNDTNIENSEYRLFWVFKGDNLNENCRITVLVDVINGNIYMKFPDYSERDEKLMR